MRKFIRKDSNNISNIFQKIGTVSSLINNLSRFRDKIETSGLSIFYRGHGNKDYEDISPIYRTKGEDIQPLIEKEDILIREIIRKCPEEFPDHTSTFEKLVKMQHYSLPTRLLDITSNPLVALFFACRGKTEKDTDGKIKIYGVEKKNVRYFDDDDVCLLANLSLMSFDTKIKKGHKDFGKIISQVKKDNPYIFINPKRFNQVLCVRPKLDNARIIRQNGAFFLFGCNETKEEPAQLDVFQEELFVNKEGKERILNELNQLGINESYLFPEIENVANALRRDIMSEKDS